MAAARHHSLARVLVVVVFVILPALVAGQSREGIAPHIDPVTPLVLALAIILAAANSVDTWPFDSASPPSAENLLRAWCSEASTSPESTGFAALKVMRRSRLSRVLEWSSFSSRSVSNRPSATCSRSG